MSRWQMWGFHSNDTRLTIWTPLFMLDIFASSPCMYRDTLESGVRVGLLPIPPEGRGYEIQFRWFYINIWKEVTRYDVFSGRCDRLGNPIQ